MWTRHTGGAGGVVLGFISDTVDKPNYRSHLRE